MARRIGMLVIVVAVVIGARLLSHRSVDAELALEFGARAPGVRAATLVFTDAHEHVARELRLAYPAGAPKTERRALHLRAGRYTVGARVDFASGEPLTRSFPLDVADPGTYSIDFTN